MNGPGSVTQMAVIVRIKQAGTYISNATVDAGTIRGSTANSYDSIFN